MSGTQPDPYLDAIAAGRASEYAPVPEQAIADAVPQEAELEPNFDHVRIEDVHEGCRCVSKDMPCWPAAFPGSQIRASLGGAKRVAELEQLARDILAAFHATGDGHRARAGQVQIARWEAMLAGRH